MEATEKQLKERWLTPEGIEVRQNIINHIKGKNWEEFLKGFSFVEEVSSGKDLRGIDLSGAPLWNANLWKVDFRKADLRRARLFGSFLGDADLRGADLRKALLNGTLFLRTNLIGANLTGASIFGVSTWNIIIDESTVMNNLIIEEDPLITVDNIEIAQFIYMIINNKKLSNVITTMRTKSVLILGSFKDEYKENLNSIRDIIYKNNYIPIVFDFNPSNLQTLIDTIEALSLLSRFVIIDLTKSAGQLIELALFDRLKIPYALIVSDTAEPVPRNIDKYTMTKWCYKNEVVLYREGELNELINNGIAVWAEEINNEYEKDIIGSRKKNKELNKILYKNIGKK